MSIGERIFELLDEKKISQKTFSQRTGIAQSTISDWKRKKTNPASDKIMIICRVLNITPEELLTGSKAAENKSADYYLVGKETADHMLLEQYHSLKRADKERIWGYMQSLLDKREGK